MTYNKLVLVFKGLLLWFTVFWTLFCLSSIDYFLSCNGLLPYFALMTVAGCILCCFLTLTFKEFVLLSGYKIFYKLLNGKKLCM